MKTQVQYRINIAFVSDFWSLLVLLLPGLVTLCRACLTFSNWSSGWYPNYTNAVGVQIIAYLSCSGVSYWACRCLVVHGLLWLCSMWRNGHTRRELPAHMASSSSLSSLWVRYWRNKAWYLDCLASIQSSTLVSLSQGYSLSDSVFSLVEWAHDSSFLLGGLQQHHKLVHADLWDSVCPGGGSESGFIQALFRWF